MFGTKRVIRLIHGAILLCSVALVGLSAGVLWQVHDAALHGATDAARDLARVAGDAVLRDLGACDLAAQALAAEILARGPVASSDAAALRRDLPGMTRRIAARGPGSRGAAGDAATATPWNAPAAMLVDSAGTPVASTPDPPPGASLGGQRWFEALRQGGERHVAEAGPGLACARALRRPDGGFDGAVLVAQHADPFRELASGLASGLPSSGAALALRDAEGRLLAGTGPPPASLLADGSPDGQGDGLAAAPPDGQDRVVAHHRLPGWPVFVTASLPAAGGLAALPRGLSRTLWLGGALALGLGGLAWLAATAARQEARRRAALAAAHAELRRAQASLEARLAERSRSLADAEQQRRDGEARFRGLFDALAQSLVLLAPDGTVLEANRAALDLLPGTPEQRHAAVIGRPFWEAPWWGAAGRAAGGAAADAGGGPDAQRERVRDAVRRAAAGEVAHEETTLRSADGRALVCDLSLSPVLDEAGRVLLLVSEARDVTALRTAHAQLHEAQKLETLGHLTGGVAHDFNNLLMVVLGNLNLLRKRLPEDPRTRRLLDGALQGAERGAALTQRLLAFARRQELRPVAIRLHGLVAGMSDLLRRSLGPVVRVRIEVPASLPPVRADANQLELALLNLAVNARDAMPLGGDLLIAATVATVPGPGPPAPLPAAPLPQAHLAKAPLPGLPAPPPALAPGGYLRIAVTDSGTGMDAETLARAAEPFFTTKGPGKGSGLGLAMVHGLAAQAGGQLTIESRFGAGTTVALWLPLADAVAEARPAALAAPAATRPLDVLLVDDDALIQAGSAAMLEDLGHHVTVAGSGPAALEALRQARFELLVTDFAMPGMTGLDLLREAAALQPGLPAILATGFAELPPGEAGDLTRLAKPYRQEDLAAAIARVMGRPAGEPGQNPTDGPDDERSAGPIGGSLATPASDGTGAAGTATGSVLPSRSQRAG